MGRATRTKVALVGFALVVAFGCGTGVDVAIGGGDAGTDASVNNTSDASAIDGSNIGSNDGSAHDGSDGEVTDGGTTITDAAEGGAAYDGPCTPLASLPVPCGPMTCNQASNFCIGGSVMNKCDPLPPECACQETHSCACVLTNVGNPCDAGTVSCSATQDGGDLFVAISGAGGAMCN